MNNKTNKVFMAFAKGQESKEAGSIKKICWCRIRICN